MDALLSFNIADYFYLYENEIYRIVEGQHFIATRKLVDSDEEQRVLEKILDQSKPPVATYNSRGELHYLLYTPFRYPPLKSGGRFHTRIEQSIFYGAEDLKTAMAEIAYRRFEFMRHSSGVFQPMHVAHTHFTVLVKSAKAVLLTNMPFVQYRGNVSHPSSYSTSQALGASMRSNGAEMFNFYSARQQGGVNVGLFSNEAFVKNKPSNETHWSVFIDAETVEFKRVNFGSGNRKTYVFDVRDFYDGGKFAMVMK